MVWHHGTTGGTAPAGGCSGSRPVGRVWLRGVVVMSQSQDQDTLELLDWYVILSPADDSPGQAPDRAEQAECIRRCVRDFKHKLRQLRRQGMVPIQWGTESVEEGGAL